MIFSEDSMPDNLQFLIKYLKFLSGRSLMVNGIWDTDLTTTDLTTEKVDRHLRGYLTIAKPRLAWGCTTPSEARASKRWSPSARE